MTVTTDTVNIRRLIRDELADRDEFTYADVAASIYLALDDDSRDVALREALPALVRDVARTDSESARRAPTRGQPTSGRSAKVAGIREAWRANLEAVYSTGGGHMKRLGDFDRDELDALVVTIREMAERNAAMAARYEKVHAAMAERGVDRVRDLDDATLADLLGGDEL